MATTAEVLLDLLAARDVSTVFGVPGNHTVELYRGLAARGIRHVTARHEQGAAFMADGFARATGQPGVCLLISGPGFLNAATAIAQSLADSIPLLVISGVASRADLGMARGTLHELPDQQATASSFCRTSSTLLTPVNLETLVNEAFSGFVTRRPGPVHIEIPLDLMAADCPAAAGSEPPRISAPGPDPSLIQATAECLAAAENPLLLLGGGARGAAAALPRLAELIDCPVLNTVNAKGLIPAAHPLAVGGSPSVPALAEALVNSDLVLAIGTEMSETDYDLLMTGGLPPLANLIRIDVDSRQLLIPHPPMLGITADARLAVEALLTALTEIRADSPARAVSGSSRAGALRNSVQAEPHCHPEMAAFFAAIDRAAPDAILVGDSTRPTYYATWQLERSSPGSYFHSVSGFGTLGYALPAAFGAALGSVDDRPVLALIGDGGIQFTLPELSTAAELKLAVAVIIWHNDGYREIENSMQVRQIPTDSTAIRAPDFEAAARAHNADYANPRSTAELEGVIRTALDADGPTLIEVREADFLTLPSGEWYS